MDFDTLAHWAVVIFFLSVGVCGIIYGLSPNDKYSMYRKSDDHYSKEDNT